MNESWGIRRIEVYMKERDNANNLSDQAAIIGAALLVIGGLVGLLSIAVADTETTDDSNANNKTQ